MRYWKRLKYISIIGMVGKKGGKQYHYQTTDKLELQLRDILISLLRGRGFEESDIDKIVKNK